MSANSLTLPGHSFLAAFAAALAIAFLATQSIAAGTRRTDLQRHDLSIPGREVVQTRVEFDVGVTAPRHSHSGEEIIYVLEGTLEYRIDGQPPVTVKAGEVFFVPAGAVHSAKNVGSERAAELATYVVEKGKPLVVLATDVSH